MSEKEGAGGRSLLNFDSQYMQCTNSTRNKWSVAAFGAWWLPLAPVVVWLPLAPVAAFGAGGGCVVGNLRWRRLFFLVLCDFSVYHFFGA